MKVLIQFVSGKLSIVFALKSCPFCQVIVPYSMRELREFTIFQFGKNAFI
jgi:hypothetical protein